MSRASKPADAACTATMLDLVHRRYREEYREGNQLPPRYVTIEEVASGTGLSGARRFADVVAVSMWPSDGLMVHGYEIKASRSDLKRELADLSKHEAVARYCDTWTLVVWSESVLVDGIPDDWGIQVVEATEYGHQLVSKQPARKRTPVDRPWAFACALIRNAYQQSPSAAYVARAAVEANKKGRNEGRDIADGNWRHALTPLARAVIGERHSWHHNIDDPGNFAELALERFNQGVLTPARG